MELSPLCFLQYLTHQLSQFCEEITIHTLGSKLDICFISAQRALPNNVLPAITYKFLPAVYDGQFEAKSTSSYKNFLLHRYLLLVSACPHCLPRPPQETVVEVEEAGGWEMKAPAGTH